MDRVHTAGRGQKGGNRSEDEKERGVRRVQQEGEQGEENVRDVERKNEGEGNQMGRV